MASASALSTLFVSDFLVSWCLHVNIAPTESQRKRKRDIYIERETSRQQAARERDHNTTGAVKGFLNRTTEHTSSESRDGLSYNSLHMRLENWQSSETKTNTFGGSITTTAVELVSC